MRREGGERDMRRMSGKVIMLDYAECVKMPIVFPISDR